MREDVYLLKCLTLIIICSTRGGRPLHVLCHLHVVTEWNATVEARSAAFIVIIAVVNRDVRGGRKIHLLCLLHAVTERHEAVEPRAADLILYARPHSSKLSPSSTRTSVAAVNLIFCVISMLLQSGMRRWNTLSI